MPIHNYGVLTAHPVQGKKGVQNNPHYQIHVVGGQGSDYRVAVNVLSQQSPSELEYHVNDNFKHPIITKLLQLSSGFTRITSGQRHDDLAIDYVRSDIINADQMKPLPFDIAHSESELNDLLDSRIQQAIQDPNALIFAFGARWLPKPHEVDKIFGFSPDNGIHNIHMNQGNSAGFVHDDGIWQDGALFMHIPSTGQNVAIFLKFQSQSWQTDDAGHTIHGGGN